jgi:hypothetical protein
MSAYQYSTAAAYQQGYTADDQYQQPPRDVATGDGSSVGSDVGSSTSSSGGSSGSTSSSFDDPRIADLPRILLMGPRRGGKTSIQVSLDGGVDATTLWRSSR